MLAAAYAQSYAPFLSFVSSLFAFFFSSLFFRDPHSLSSCRSHSVTRVFGEFQASNSDIDDGEKTHHSRFLSEIREIR